MHKCVDARGVTQYSDKPCPDGSKGSAVDIKGQPPISGKLTPYKEDLKRAERDFQRRQGQQAREEDAAARQAAQQKQRCDSMRQQLQRAQAARRPADAAAHDARIKALESEIAQKCR
jgi:multidrug resistance efflux pump